MKMDRFFSQLYLRFHSCSHSFKKIFALTLISILSTTLFLACEKEPKPEFRIVYYPDKQNIKEEWSSIRLPNGDTLEHGNHRKHYKMGQVSESDVWVKGVRNGTSQAWYEDGGTKWQRNYVNGKKEGTFRLNFVGGHPWMVVNYVDNRIEGKVQVWDREDVTTPREAVFTKGNCSSGDCGLFDAPPASAETSPEKMVLQKRANEIVQAFLN